MSSLRSICVIDDDMIYQFAIRLNLKRHKLAKEVLTFDNGEEAKRYFQANAGDPEKLPDVILLDINMPVMDGWDFLDKMNDILMDTGVSVFILSSSINPEDMEKSKQYSSVLKYILKPLSLDKIGTILGLIQKSGRLKE